MIRIEFTEDEIKQLRDILSHHSHPFTRQKALALLLKSQGISHYKITEIIKVCENTLRGYFKSYLKKGITGFTTINFRKPESSLHQFETVITKHFKEKPPASIKQARSEIETLTGICLKETQTRYYLKRLGLRFRKVAGIPAKANIAEQQSFLETKLQPCLEEAEMGQRKVYFVDAAHFVLGAFLGYLWSFAQIFIKTPNGRQRFNVLGALDAITKELLTIANTTYITSIQVCELLDLITEKATDSVTKIMWPVTIVFDNAKYQRCKLVEDKAKSLNIELLFLPPYSPNLNLIERVWKFTRKECLNSKYYADFNLFKMAISGFLTNMHLKHATDLKTLLTLKFQVFKESQFESVN